MMSDTIDAVLIEVAGRFGVSVNDIRSSRRNRQVLPARHVAAYLAYRITGMSTRAIGKRIGGRDYTNIEMYCRTVARRAAEDEAFSLLVHDLEGSIRSRGY